jgi:aryl-alcohol dehydrogenase-like predicted oxidoreductase
MLIPCELGVGTWAWGNTTLWGYDTKNDGQLQQTFAAAIDAGVPFFDTAEGYGDGRSEQLCGQFEQATKKQAIVATKFCPTIKTWSAAALSEHLTASLKRLQRQHVELFQIHGMAMSVRSVETWIAQMIIEYKAGRVKAVGVSNFTTDQLQRAHATLKAAGVPLASQQIEFSLLRRKPELTGMLDLCKKLDVAVIAYSPLAMGRLSGKYSSKNPPPADRNFGAADLASLDKIVDTLSAIAKRLEKTPSQVALNWVLCKGAFPIIGAKNEQQV